MIEFKLTMVTESLEFESLIVQIVHWTKLPNLQLSKHSFFQYNLLIIQPFEIIFDTVSFVTSIRR